MILNVACAYCAKLNQLKIMNEVTLRHREIQIGPAIKCTYCGSRFVLEMSTKRAGKGRARKDQEAADARAHELTVDRIRDMSKRLGDQLLAQPTCTCQHQIDYHREREQTFGMSGKDTGHPLSTGWIYKDWAKGMIPTKPHHFYSCPLSGGDLESKARLAFDWGEGEDAS